MVFAALVSNAGGLVVRSRHPFSSGLARPGLSQLPSRSQARLALRVAPRQAVSMGVGEFLSAPFRFIKSTKAALASGAWDPMADIGYK